MSTQNQTQNNTDFFDLVQPSEQSVAANLRIIENVQAAIKPKKVRKPALPPFIMSSDFKARIKALKNNTENENVKLIVDKFLSTKKIGEAYNYIGLSNADYSKISYLDKDRIAKNEDKTYNKLTLNTEDGFLVFNINSYTNFNDNKYNNNFDYGNFYSGKPEENIDDIVRHLSSIVGFNHIKRQYITKYNKLKIDLKTRYNKSKFDNIETLCSHYYEYGHNSEISNIDDTILKLHRGEISLNQFINNIVGYNFLVFKDVFYVKTGLLNVKHISGHKPKEERDSLGIYMNKYRSGNLLKINSDDIIYSFNNNHHNMHIYVPVTLSTESKLWDADVRYHTTVGKMVRKLFPNAYNDRQIAEFSEEYSKLVIKNNNLKYLEVSGEDIRTNYHEKNCYNAGTLGNSCMRYVHTQAYLDIYVKLDCCKLAVIKNKQGLNVARAILWTKDNVTYRDRIYYANNEALYEIENIFKDKGYINIHGSGQRLDISLPLSQFNEFKYFPYMDTLCNYSPTQEILSNIYFSDKHYVMRNTGGYYTTQNNEEDDDEDNYSYCECCDERYHNEDFHQISNNSEQYAGSYLCVDCATYINIENDYYPSDECDTWARTSLNHSVKEAIPSYRTFKTYDGETFALILEDRHNVDQYYYLPDNFESKNFFLNIDPLVVIDGYYYHPDYLPEGVTVNDNSNEEVISENSTNQELPL